MVNSDPCIHNHVTVLFMRSTYMPAVHIALVLAFLCGSLYAQRPQPSTTVPRLVRISSTFHPVDGLAVSPVESVTLSIYREANGGSPLWSETQNVDVTPDGSYTVLMGSTIPDGVPADLFATGEPRWLGVLFNRLREVEQPRVLLASVPYALRAATADTLGGRPVTDFLLADAVHSGASAGVAAETSGGRRAFSLSDRKSSSAAPRTSGAQNCIGLFIDTANLGCSSAWQNAGNIGIGTASPAAPLHVARDGSYQGAFGGVTNFKKQLQLGYNTSGSYSWIASTTVGQSWDPLVLQPYGGSVGIGTTNPSGLLHLAGTSGTTGLVLDNGVQIRQKNASGTVTNLLTRWANNMVYLDNFDGAINIRTGPCCYPVEFIADTGNVGIGTDHPSYKLDVAGDLNFSGTLRRQGIPVLQVATTSGITATGFQALQVNTTGTDNTAVGYEALGLNTSGKQNTAEGSYSLFWNTIGNYNAAFGYGALQGNTTGSNNTAVGYNALGSAGAAGNNTAVGSGSLFANTTGSANTAAGYSALRNNTLGDQNTAVGEYALYGNTTGVYNTAAGNNALYNLTTGTNNVAIGYQAGYLVGIGGGTTNNNIHIGSMGAAADNGTIRIGTPGTQTSFYAAGIFAANVADGVPVYINSSGRFGIQQSSRRYKEDIHDMGDSSRGLLRLRPVTFRYKQPLADGTQPLQYGLIAEEVAEIYPDLVVRASDGQLETVKYQMLNAMLLNELQRQHSELEAQSARIRSLEEEGNEQRRRNQALAERLEKLESALTPNSH